MSSLTWYEEKILELIDIKKMSIEQISCEANIPFDYIKDVYRLAKRKEEHDKKKTDKSRNTFSTKQRTR